MGGAASSTRRRPIRGAGHGASSSAAWRGDHPEVSLGDATHHLPRRGAATPAHYEHQQGWMRERAGREAEAGGGWGGSGQEQMDDASVALDQARAHARRLAAVVEEDDFEVQTALAIRASRAGSHATAHLQAELALQRHRGSQLGGLSAHDLKAMGVEASRLGAASTLSRTRGQALAARYWISHCLDCDDVLDASADGFYDVWSGGLEDAESGQLPDLSSLLRRASDVASDVLSGERERPGPGWLAAAGEVLLVDRQTDEFLVSLDSLAVDKCGSLPNVWDRALVLAELVAERMGGALGHEGDAAAAAAWEAERRLLTAANKGCPVIHIGHCTKGLSRHRALLFKALAGPLNVPCRLIRGAYYTGDERSAGIVLVPQDGGAELRVDLTAAPGRLSSSARSGGGEHTPVGAVGGGGNRTTDADSAPRCSPRCSHAPSAADDEYDTAVFSLRTAHPRISEETAIEAYLACGGDLARANAVCRTSAVVGTVVPVNDIVELLTAAGWDVMSALAQLQEAVDARRKNGEAQKASRATAAAGSNAGRSGGSQEGREAVRRRTKMAAEVHAAADRAAREASERYRTSADSARRREALVATRQADRVASLRLDDREAAASAGEAERIRREFLETWEPRVKAMQLPAVLVAFGVEVEGAAGGGAPTAGQLRRAYRQAVLRFHPDRQGGRATVRERVEAEETFKIISRKMDEW